MCHASSCSCRDTLRPCLVFQLDGSGPQGSEYLPLDIKQAIGKIQDSSFPFTTDAVVGISIGIIVIIFSVQQFGTKKIRCGGRSVLWPGSNP